MDTFENKEPFETDTPAQEPADEDISEILSEPVTEPVSGSAPYHAAGTGRRESPYANSPYEILHREEPRQEPRQEAPRFETKKPKKAKKHSGFWKKALSFVLILALVAGSCAFTASMINSRWEDRMDRTEKAFSDQIHDLQQQINSVAGASGVVVGSAAHTGDALTPGQVYAYAVNSVVAISSTVVSSNGFYGMQEGTATGSGFILTENGYVVTNYHVIEDATAVSVITHDGTEYTAAIVGADESNDVAVLKVEATGLPAVKLGSSDALVIGDMVVAIGNPLGELTSTQTVGYVSGKDRDVNTDNSIISMIQTDAAINSGNSGGPLFNMYGEVVGITTAKYSGTSGSGASIEGIGFAIPIDDVAGIISDLMDYGYVTGAYMGISVSDTDESSAAMFGLPTGAYVVSVEPGYAAQRAGIQAKDIIVEVGGHEVTGITSLTRALRHFKAGDTTNVIVVRGGSRLELTITFDEKPNTTSSTPVPSDEIPMPSDGDYQEWFDYFDKQFGENGWQDFGKNGG